MKKALIILTMLLSCQSFAGNYTVDRVNANTTLTTHSPEFIEFTADNLNINLPACNGTNTGQFFIFKENFNGTNTVCIYANGTDTFDGSSGLCMTYTQADTAVCDGTGKWLSVNYF